MLVGKKILIVEDDMFIRELYVLFLKEDGYTVVEAEDGKKGIDRFKEEIFDLVLLDILLPEKDGISVLAEMKKINSKVPVVMLTNLAQENMIQKSFALGASGYLVKARISKKELLKEVRDFIEHTVSV